MIGARFFPKWKQIRDIDRPEDVYLSRLMLLRLPWVGVYLHIIRRPDWSTCQHDHPWPFVTFILRGGYVERIGTKEFTRKPGYVGYRGRSFEHRIIHLPRGTAVTLVIRGRNAEVWGFRTLKGWLDWRKYLELSNGARVLWCDDRHEPIQGNAAE